jgi:hypothetical protein
MPARPTSPRDWGRGAPRGRGAGRRPAAALALLLLTAAAPGEPLQPRRARFEEVGDSVLLTVALPELLSPQDAAAMAALESAIVARLRYAVEVHRAGDDAPLERRDVEVTLRWDPWKERYVVATAEPGRGTTTRYYADRDAAVAAAVTLERLRVARAGALERGPAATYEAVVVGRRDPAERGLLAPGAGRAAPARDLGLFARWVGLWVGDGADADASLGLRTVPGFYLVPR